MQLILDCKLKYGPDEEKVAELIHVRPHLNIFLSGSQIILRACVNIKDTVL